MGSGAGSRRARCQGRGLRKVQAGGPCAKSQGELGRSAAGGLGLGKQEEGPGGLGQIHGCIWQSEKRQLSEAGPLASWRGELQGPGDTPPPPRADSGVPLLFP